ncbi:DedA family protein [Nocardia sp. CA-120079]|uniref:DedA family protein n=1 Tax=Nocardia sp. CA-120079 TaxID=3239974 RepID=UPI003D96E3D3
MEIYWRTWMLPYLARAVEAPTGGLAGWAVDLIDTLGGPGLALMSGLDSMLSVVPADLVMPLVGFSATQGAINLGAAIAWATAGSVAGSLALYFLGMLLGRERAWALLIRIPGIKPKMLDRSEVWFGRHGAKAVVFGRLLPGVRALISLPAGVERMSLLKFVILTAVGSLMWNSTLLLAGYLLGANWHLMADIFGMLIYVLIGAAALVVAYLVVRRWRTKPAGPTYGGSGTSPKTR